jgi:hypothetical protein
MTSDSWKRERFAGFSPSLSGSKPYEPARLSRYAGVVEPGNLWREGGREGGGRGG